jgi:hypothetical protein
MLNVYYPLCTLLPEKINITCDRSAKIRKKILAGEQHSEIDVIECVWRVARGIDVKFRR